MRNISHFLQPLVEPAAQEMSRIAKFYAIAALTPGAIILLRAPLTGMARPIAAVRYFGVGVGKRKHLSHTKHALIANGN